MRFCTALDPAEAAQVAAMLRSRHALGEDPRS
jgi:hypothetical protein